MASTLVACGDDVADGGGDEGSSSTSVGGTTDPGTTTAAASSTSDGGSGSTSVATSGSSAGDATGSTTGEGSESSSGEVLPPCDYPILWPADPDAQATAQAALDVLAPEATLTWDDDRGTLTNLQDLDVVFPCEDDTPLMEAVFAFFETHPELFQMDGAEWLTGGGTLCQHVDDPTPSTFNTSRRGIGSWTVLRDVVAVRLYRTEAGEVAMRSMNATYVPPMPDEVAMQVQACVDNGPNPMLLEDTMRAEGFDYLIYGGAKLCQPSGQGSYTAADADAVVFAPDALVSWSEAGGSQTQVSIAQRLELILDASSITDELLASSAACPEPDGPGVVVGFWAYLDLVTAELSNEMAGLGCVVC